MPIYEFECNNERCASNSRYDQEFSIAEPHDLDCPSVGSPCERCIQVSQASSSKVQDSIQPTNKLLVFDFFSGTGSSTQAFEDAGHTVIKVELDPYFEAHERDILALTAEELIAKYGQPDFIWASPPCQKFSVASLWKYWEGTRGKSVPKHPAVYEAIALVEHTVNLMQSLNPTYGWVMENPRGMLRHQDVVKPFQRWTVSYCQYGDTRMKPTDIWGTIQGWTPRPMCKPRATCHESSPTGTNAGGTGKLKNARLRSMIPYELGAELLTVVDNLGTKHHSTLTTRGGYPHA